MERRISMPVRAALDGSLQHWYADAAVTAAAYLCPAAVVARAQHSRDGFTLPGTPGFPDYWWTSV